MLSAKSPSVKSVNFGVESAQFANDPENGRLLRLSCQAAPNRQENKELTVVIDVSGSMFPSEFLANPGEGNIIPVIQAVTRFLNGLEPGSKFTLILFDTNACTIAKNVLVTNEKNSQAEINALNYFQPTTHDGKANPNYIGKSANLPKIYIEVLRNKLCLTLSKPKLEDMLPDKLYIYKHPNNNPLMYMCEGIGITPFDFDIRDLNERNRHNTFTQVFQAIETDQSLPRLADESIKAFFGFTTAKGYLSGGCYEGGTAFTPALTQAFSGISREQLHRSTVLILTDGEAKEKPQELLAKIPEMLGHQKTANNEEVIIPRALCFGIGAQADSKGILAYLSRKTKQPFFRIKDGNLQEIGEICKQLQADFYIGVRTPSADLIVTTEYGTETIKLGQHVYGVPFGATFYMPVAAQYCRIEVRFKEADGTSYSIYQEINPATILNHLCFSEQGLTINANWLEKEIDKLKEDYSPAVINLPTLEEQFQEGPMHSTQGNTNRGVIGITNATLI